MSIKRDSKKERDDKIELPKNLPLLLKSVVDSNKELIFQGTKNSQKEFVYETYSCVYDKIISLSHALLKLGLKRKENVAIISDNRAEWLITDMAIMSLGCSDVPRSSDSLPKDIRYIISFTECRIAFIETGRQLSKLLSHIEEIPNLKTIIHYDEINDDILHEAENKGLKTITYKNLLNDGQYIVENLEKEKKDSAKEIIETEMNKTETNDVATIIFTSGTTGTPKGVMLTHRNFLAQLEVVHNVLTVKPGDMWLCVLPVWHSFERVMEYIAITLKSGLAYSKPVASILLDDLKKVKPQWICGVPRLWEALALGVVKKINKENEFTKFFCYFFISTGKIFIGLRDRLTNQICRYKKTSRFVEIALSIIPFILLAPIYLLGEIFLFKKIRNKFGGRIVGAISGGGKLNEDIDKFYRVINFNLLEGYGITEAGPVLSVRNCTKPRFGCVGEIYPSAKVKIVEHDGLIPFIDKPVPNGKQGLILAYGDQIMKGYYKQKELEENVLLSDGWLNTGDLGILSLENEIEIKGRVKETIVLSDGENIEPREIELALDITNYIESSIVLGQDKKYLGALIVPCKTEILNFAHDNNIDFETYNELLQTQEIKKLIRNEIDTAINQQNGFSIRQLIYKFVILENSFTIGKELSVKQEPKRFVINELYHKEIESLFT